MTQPDYDKRKKQLHEYHQKRYQENAEHFRAKSREWYEQNKARRSEKKRADYIANYKPKFLIYITDPNGMSYEPVRFLSVACTQFGLPYKTLVVKKYPFEWKGYKFVRV